MKIIALLLALLAPAAFAATDDAKAPADTTESVRAKQDLLWGRMEESIGTIVRETDAVVGVAILDLTDQRAFYLNADAIYPTASTIKIAVLAELYRQHERGSGAKLGDLYTVISLPQIHQVYMMFRSRLLDLDFGPGTESLEVRLFDESEIPWAELAFRTIARTLRNFFLDRRLGKFSLHVSSIERRAPLPPDLLAAG